MEEVALGQGLDIPQDLALVAADVSAYADDAPVSISGVACSPHEVCRHAIETIEQIDPGRHDRHARLVPPVMAPLHLTVCASCAAGLEKSENEETTSAKTAIAGRCALVASCSAQNRQNKP